jgi:hypothetical protein
MVLAKKWQATTSKPRGTGTQVKAVNPGKAQLIAVVDKKVGENSEKIAQKLIDTVLESDWTGAKLLFALADGLIDCENPAVMRQLCTYAEKLGAEQQVASDATDEEAVG